MLRPTPIFFLPGCSRTRRLRQTSACLWTASRERKLRRREGTKQNPNDTRILTRHDRPAAGRFADVAGGKCHYRDQRRANRERDRRLAIDSVAMGGTAARAGRESERPAGHRIFSGASPRHPDTGHTEAKAERQPFRETHLSFFQDGFDESRGARIRSCRRAGGCGGAGGRTNLGARKSGTQVAFRARGGNLCDAASSAKAGAGAGSAADHDGRTLRAFRGASSDGADRRPEVAERPAYSRQKSGWNPDGDARGAESSPICDCGNRSERESGKISRRACDSCDFPSGGNGQATITHGTVGAVAAWIREGLQSIRKRSRGQRND